MICAYVSYVGNKSPTTHKHTQTHTHTTHIFTAVHLYIPQQRKKSFHSMTSPCWFLAAFGKAVFQITIVCLGTLACPHLVFAVECQTARQTGLNSPTSAGSTMPTAGELSASICKEMFWKRIPILLIIDDTANLIKWLISDDYFENGVKRHAAKFRVPGDVLWRVWQMTAPCFRDATTPQPIDQTRNKCITSHNCEDPIAIFSQSECHKT